MEYDPEPDLRALEAMASNLTPYLYENELYGTLSRNLPQLTVGGLLYRLHRLQGLEEQLESDQQQRLRDAAINFQQLRSEWMVHYQGKVQQELRARLNNYSVYLSESDLQAAYPSEAVHRTIIHHLMEEAEKLDILEPAHQELLDSLDRRLQAASRDSEEKFIWAKELEPLYPAETFWWLYRTPQNASS
jgi:hypothetical protein